MVTRGLERVTSPAGDLGVGPLFDHDTPRVVHGKAEADDRVKRSLRKQHRCGGANRMPWPHFMLAIVGACLWGSYRLAAYWLGRQVERLAGWMVFVFGPPPFLC